MMMMMMMMMMMFTSWLSNSKRKWCMFYAQLETVLEFKDIILDI